MKRYVEDGVHPQLIIRAIRKSSQLAVERINELCAKIGSEGNKRETLIKCAATAMSSKLVAANKEFFSNMVVDAVLSIEQDILPLEMIGIKKVPGGALEESRLVQGVAFKKTFSYAGFEMQEKVKVLYQNINLLNFS